MTIFVYNYTMFAIKLQQRFEQTPSRAENKQVFRVSYQRKECLRVESGAPMRRSSTSGLGHGLVAANAAKLLPEWNRAKMAKDPNTVVVYAFW